MPAARWAQEGITRQSSFFYGRQQKGTKTVHELKPDAPIIGERFPHAKLTDAKVLLLVESASQPTSIHSLAIYKSPTHMKRVTMVTAMTGRALAQERLRFRISF